MTEPKTTESLETESKSNIISDLSIKDIPLETESNAISDLSIKGIPLDPEPKVLWYIERYTNGAKNRTIDKAQEFPDKSSAVKVWNTICQVDRGKYPFMYFYQISRVQACKATIIDDLSSNIFCELTI